MLFYIGWYLIGLVSITITAFVIKYDFKISVNNKYGTYPDYNWKELTNYNVLAIVFGALAGPVCLLIMVISITILISSVIDTGSTKAWGNKPFIKLKK
jgi:hypothetical protein